MSSLNRCLKNIFFLFFIASLANSTVYADSLVDLRPQIQHIISNKTAKINLEFNVKSKNGPIYVKPQLTGPKDYTILKQLNTQDVLLLKQNQNTKINFILTPKKNILDKDYIYNLSLQVINPIKNTQDQVEFNFVPNISSTAIISVTSDGQIDKNIDLALFGLSGPRVSFANITQNIIATLQNKSQNSAFIEGKLTVRYPNNKNIDYLVKPTVILPTSQTQLSGESFGIITKLKPELSFGQYKLYLAIKINGSKEPDLNASTTIYILPNVYLLCFLIVCSIVFFIVLGIIFAKFLTNTNGRLKKHITSNFRKSN